MCPTDDEAVLYVNEPGNVIDKRSEHRLAAAPGVIGR